MPTVLRCILIILLCLPIFYILFGPKGRKFGRDRMERFAVVLVLCLAIGAIWMIYEIIVNWDELVYFLKFIRLI